MPRQRTEITSLENEIDQYTQIENTLSPKFEAAQRQLVEGKSSLSAHKSRGLYNQFNLNNIKYCFTRTYIHIEETI